MMAGEPQVVIFSGAIQTLFPITYQCPKINNIYFINYYTRKYWSNIMQSATLVCPSGKEAMQILQWTIPEVSFTQLNPWQGGPENKTFIFLKYHLFNVWLKTLPFQMIRKDWSLFWVSVHVCKGLPQDVLDYYKHTLEPCCSKSDP